MTVNGLKYCLKKIEDVEVINMTANFHIYMSQYDLSSIKILEEEMLLKITDLKEFVHLFDINDINTVTLNPKHLEVNSIFMP